MKGADNAISYKPVTEVSEKTEIVEMCSEKVVANINI